MVTAPTKTGMWECRTEAFGGLFCYDCASQFRKDNGIPEERTEAYDAEESDAYAVRIAYWEYDRDEVCDNCQRACEL
jgi:hypothetical protein